VCETRAEVVGIKEGIRRHTLRTICAAPMARLATVFGRWESEGERVRERNVGGLV
jgi:hypothetical protein